jgi:hypothetical protein
MFFLTINALYLFSPGIQARDILIDHFGFKSRRFVLPLEYPELILSASTALPALKAVLQRVNRENVMTYWFSLNLAAKLIANLVQERPLVLQARLPKRVFNQFKLIKTNAEEIRRVCECKFSEYLGINLYSMDETFKVTSSYDDWIVLLHLKKITLQYTQLIPTTDAVAQIALLILVNSFYSLEANEQDIGEFTDIFTDLKINTDGKGPKSFLKNQSFLIATFFAKFPTKETSKYPSLVNLLKLHVTFCASYIMEHFSLELLQFGSEIFQTAWFYRFENIHFIRSSSEEALAIFSEFRQQPEFLQSYSPSLRRFTKIFYDFFKSLCLMQRINKPTNISR